MCTKVLSKESFEGKSNKTFCVIYYNYYNCVLVWIKAYNLILTFLQIVQYQDIATIYSSYVCTVRMF